MAIEKLSSLAVRRATKPGYLNDGGGLYLCIGKGGAKSWVFRFRDAGRLREMGLGPFHTVSLAEARQKARECRRMRLDGIDPIAQRREKRRPTMTFRDCAEAYIAAHRPGWKNWKHAAQWPSTMRDYVYPVFGDMPAQRVDTTLVVKAVQPIWASKTETAKRVRGRIESILDWATVSGFRSGDNPARWKGHLDKLLPSPGRVQKVEHHAALPYADLPAFMAALRARDGSGARALEFTILTAARTGEVTGAVWSEFEGDLWTVPGRRMKEERDHRVPLSDAAQKLLGSPSDGLVFRGLSGGQLSENTMLAVLRRMGCDVTTHGFRSTFRDWVAECTTFPNEVAEMALSHAVGDRVEAAYRRGDLFEKRRELMEAWAAYCGAS